MDLHPMATGSGVAFAMLPPHPRQPNPPPALLLLASAAADTLGTEPYSLVGRHLHTQGWNVFSLDLPCHGADQRPDEPAGLAGWAARSARGEDLVAAFRQQVDAVVAHLVAAGLAGRFAAAGTSRGGFLAFHAAAGNPRLQAVAGFAPVTDLLALSEFAGQETNPLVHRLALGQALGPLADRAAWITIGNADARVDSARAVAFAQGLVQAALAGSLPPRVTLQLLPTPGHASYPEWHQQAAAWLRLQLEG